MSRKSRKEYFKKQAQNKALSGHAENRMADTISGMGGKQDRGANFFNATDVWWCSQNPFLHSGNNFYFNKLAYQLYYGDWAANKVVSIPVDDMFREGLNFKYCGEDTDLDKALQDEWDRLGLTKEYIKAKKLERLTGGAIGILGIDHDDSKIKAEIPLCPSSVQKGCLKFINIVGRNRVAKVDFQHDPMKPNYNRPEFYWVDGNKIHRTRLVVFDGSPISSNPSYDFYISSGYNDGFGVSVLARIWNALSRSELGQQAGAHLMQMASVLIMLRTDLRDLKMNRQGNAALAQERQMMETISMYKSYIVDGEKVDIKQIAASFGSVPELINTYLQILAAGSDIPAERFLSESVGGLGNNGDSRLENYYNTIKAKQNNEATPHIMRDIMPVLISSTFGPDRYSVKDFEIEWPRLWNLSDTQKAQVDTLNTNNILNMANQLAWDDEYTLSELKRKGIIENLPDLEKMRQERIRREIEQEKAIFAQEESMGDIELLGRDHHQDVNFRMPNGRVGVGAGLPRMPQMPTIQ